MANKIEQKDGIIYVDFEGEIDVEELSSMYQTLCDIISSRRNAGESVLLFCDIRKLAKLKNAARMMITTFCRQIDVDRVAVVCIGGSLRSIVVNFGARFVVLPAFRYFNDEETAFKWLNRPLKK